MLQHWHVHLKLRCDWVSCVSRGKLSPGLGPSPDPPHGPLMLCPKVPAPLHLAATGRLPPRLRGPPPSTFQAETLPPGLPQGLGATPPGAVPRPQQVLKQPCD